MVKLSVNVGFLFTIIVFCTACRGDVQAADRDWKQLPSADTLAIYSNGNNAGSMTHIMTVNNSTGTITDETRLHIESNGLSAVETSSMELYEQRKYGFDGNLVRADQELNSAAGSNTWTLTKEKQNGWGLSVTAGGTTQTRQIAKITENLDMTYDLYSGIKSRTIKVGEVFHDTTFELISGQSVFTAISCLEIPSASNRFLWVFITVNNLTDRKERWELDTNGNTISQENFPYVLRRRTNLSAVPGQKRAPPLFETLAIPATRAAAGNEDIGLILDSSMMPDSSVGQFYRKNGQNWVVCNVAATCPGKVSPSCPDTCMQKFTRPTTTMQSADVRIVKLADSLVRGKKNRCDSIRACFDYVNKTLEKRLSPTFSNALETLSAGFGDCGEHAVLLGALLRAAHIPARVVLGLVYVDNRKGYLYHAWVTAYAGDWVFVDPALGVFPATRDRVPLVIDDTGAAIIGIAKMLGRIKIDYVKKSTAKILKP